MRTNKSNDNRTTIKTYVNGQGKVFARLMDDGTLLKSESSEQRIYRIGDGHGIPVVVAEDAARRGATKLVIYEDGGDYIWTLPMEDLLLCRRWKMKDEMKFVFPPAACKIKIKPGAPNPPLVSADTPKKEEPAEDHQRKLFDVEHSGNRWGYER